MKAQATSWYREVGEGGIHGEGAAAEEELLFEAVNDDEAVKDGVRVHGGKEVVAGHGMELGWGRGRERAPPSLLTYFLCPHGKMVLALYATELVHPV